MRDIYEIIYHIYKKCKIFSLPFDCIYVLNQYGYRVYSYSELQSINQELYEMCRSYSNDAFLFKENNLIAYNDKMPKTRIRFSLMHELGHIVLNHDYSTLEQEDEADYFASCILAPRILIHQICLDNKYKKVTADDIHDYFDISITASNRALIDYHSWFATISHTTRKPTDTELKIKELFCIDTTDTKPSVTKKTQYSKRYEEYARKSILLQQYGYEPAFYSIYDE